MDAERVARADVLRQMRRPEWVLVVQLQVPARAIAADRDRRERDGSEDLADGLEQRRRVACRWSRAKRAVSPAPQPKRARRGSKRERAPVSPAWKKLKPLEPSAGTSSMWNDAQRDVLVSVPLRPLQCIVGAHVTRNDLPSAAVWSADSHQLRSQAGSASQPR